jgi:hypothetical protein
MATNSRTPNKKIKRKLPSTPSNFENCTESNPNTASNSRLHSPHSSNILKSDFSFTNEENHPISIKMSNNNCSEEEKDKQTKNASFFITLKDELKTLNEEIQQYNNTNLILSSPPLILTPAPSSQTNQTVCVNEWLQNNTNDKGLSAAKQQRSHSIANSVTRYLADEPLVEINLNKQFYLKKSLQKSIDIVDLNAQNGNDNDNNNTHKFKICSQSQNNLKTNEDAETEEKTINKTEYETVQKILLYKNPKELKDDLNTQEVVNISPTSNNHVNKKNRRPSLSLGLQINACQRLAELDDRNLAAVVASIHPNSLIDQYKVDINEGDEILEINGFNLRNKNNDQIETILNQSAYVYNGEIELVVRRSSISSNRSKEEHENDQQAKYQDKGKFFFSKFRLFYLKLKKYKQEVF